MTKSQEGLKIVTERFGRDSVISIATMDDGRPDVRMVNAYYEDGSFYVVTYALSNKMMQIKKNSSVAVCGEWFTAHGVGENLGHVLAEKNATLIAKLREVFASWYSNGHTNEGDPNTIILRVKLTDGIIFNNGTKYKLSFLE